MGRNAVLALSVSACFVVLTACGSSHYVQRGADLYGEGRYVEADEVFARSEPRVAHAALEQRAAYAAYRGRNLRRARGSAARAILADHGHRARTRAPRHSACGRARVPRRRLARLRQPLASRAAGAASGKHRHRLLEPSPFAECRDRAPEHDHPATLAGPELVRPSVNWGRWSPRARPRAPSRPF